MKGNKYFNLINNKLLIIFLIIIFLFNSLFINSFSLVNKAYANPNSVSNEIVKEFLLPMNSPSEFKQKIIGKARELALKHKDKQGEELLFAVQTEPEFRSELLKYTDPLKLKVNIDGVDYEIVDIVNDLIEDEINAVVNEIKEQEESRNEELTEEEIEEKKVQLSLQNNRYMFPNKEIENDADNEFTGFFEFTTDDLSSVSAVADWIVRTNTYIMVEENSDGNINYYFNVPNLQQAIHNQAQDLFSVGYLMSSNMISNPYEIKGELSDWTTAEKKYGWNLPNYVYIGEKPSITLNLSQVAQDIASFENGSKLFISNILPTDLDLSEFDEKYLNGMHYNTSDYFNTYENDLNEIEEWLSHYWINLANEKPDIRLGGEDGKNIFEEDVIVSINDYNNGSVINSKLIKTLGSNYPMVMQLIFDYAEQILGISAPSVNMIRHMPYSLNTMSDSSKIYMNNISDPRCDIYEEYPEVFGAIGIVIHTMIFQFSDFILSGVGWFSSMANEINKLCDFKFLEENNIDIAFLWKGSIGSFFLILFGIVLTFMLVKNIAKFVTGKSSAMKILSTSIMTVVVIGLTSVFIFNPNYAAKSLTDTIAKVLSIGTVAVESNNTFEELYSNTASQSDKSSLRYWSVYFNAWTKFNTNHATSDDDNKFIPNSSGNEYKDFENNNTVLSDNNNINLWSAIMLENEFNQNPNLYRGLDHFMAPIITPGESKNQFTVTQNPIYNGNVQSEIPFSYLLISIEIFFASLLKVFCFFELVIDLMLILIRFLMSALDGAGEMKKVIKNIGLDITRIIGCDAIIGLIIAITFYMEGTGLFLLSLCIAALLIYMIKYMWENPSAVISPAIFGIIRNTVNKVKNTAFAIASAAGGPAGVAASIAQNIPNEGYDNEDNDEKSKLSKLKNNIKSKINKGPSKGNLEQGGKNE